MKLRTVLILAILPLALQACKEDDQTGAQVIRPAKVMTISSPSKFVKRDFPGRVEASDRVNLSFEVSGKLADFPVLEGSELKKGALVAALDTREYQYNLEQAQARYRLTDSQLQRFGALYKKGYVSGLDYDKHKSDFEVAKANLSQAQKDLKDTKLKAPFDGIIVRKYVKNYQQVKANEAIVSYQDIDNIDIKVNIPENIIANMKREGDKDDLSVRFEAVPGRTFPVKVKEFSAEADPQTQTYEAVLTMPAPKDVNILPGMTAVLLLDLPVQTELAKGVFLVPATAVFADQKGQSAVWVVDPKTNTVTSHSVKVGELNKGEVQILKGLKVDDQIVTAGVHFLQAGQKIRPLTD